jgi:uncharacterized LabA/DUF88 family protein
MDINQELKLAVLIDADNIPYANIKGMLEEIAKYGTPTFKRIYGDWTRPSLSGWKGVLLENAITPIQQYSYTKGKNSTDSALIIDAMDILYTSQVDGFCIISSDSDFTRLATRLREAGKKVFGMGEKKTPGSFIASCNKFIYIEILQTETRSPRPQATNARVARSKAAASKNAAASPAIDAAPATAVAGQNSAGLKQSKDITNPQRTPARDGNNSSASAIANAETIPGDISTDNQAENTGADKSSAVTPVNDAVIRLIEGSISDLAEEDGWVGLSVLGALIMKKKPDFDARNYGFKKLVDLVKNIPQIEIDKRETGKNNVSHFYVRWKE